VSYAGLLAGRGVIVVDHGTTRTTYEPVDATVTVGAKVSAGEPVGRLALGGSHCLPSACLHWGWIEGDTYLDPLRLVGAGPVRLLPLWRDQPVGSLHHLVVPSRSPPYAQWRSPISALLG
jgi:murein DD-endopeptidase MepM/ murein hydrolase activator NlpD